LIQQPMRRLIGRPSEFEGVHIDGVNVLLFSVKHTFDTFGVFVIYFSYVR
jgi:hypothetical protein